MAPDRTGVAASYRRYLVLVTIMLSAGLMLISGLNALIDPLWLFKHEHRLNSVQPFFDGRAQKTNWLHARVGQFDAVLLGSSRSTYIDQRGFHPWRLSISPR